MKKLTGIVLLILSFGATAWAQDKQGKELKPVKTVQTTPKYYGRLSGKQLTNSPATLQKAKMATSKTIPAIKK